MLDKLNRKIDYLRISVIDRCNLRCVYCMPEEGIESIPHDEILTYDEILRICEIVSELGIRKIKIIICITDIQILIIRHEPNRFVLKRP